MYEDLRILEATRRLVVESSESSLPWRIPEMNRELVERATHPDALDAITKQLGDDWRVHANNIIGVELAEGLTARSAVVRRDKSFFGEDNREVIFGSIEEPIRTRLGDEGIEVEFEPTPPSPFTGEKIARMAIPDHLAPSATSQEPIAPTLKDDGFIFHIGKVQFHYDRRGLRRL